jgi:predicted hydrocarbon binding protein
MSGIYSPSRKLVEFAVRLKNAPGAMAKVSSELARRGVNILSGFHTAYPGEELATWGFFVDFTSVNTSPEKVAEEIGKLDVVSEVNFAEAKFDGLIVNDLHFPILVMGERSITLRVETVGDMFGRLYEVFGSGAGVILYEMGLKAGENKAESVCGKYGVGDLKALKIVLAERIAKGWGIPELAEFNKEEPSITIRVQDLFECLPFKGKLRETRSNFFRGYLTGLLSVLFDKKVTIVEVECIAKGDQYCVFTTK